MAFKTKVSESEFTHPAISIVICARNEEQNLVDFLPKVLSQDYPDFQVVVVNDRSWDETIDVLRAFEQSNDHLKVVDNPDVGKDGFAKKFAITLGIKACKNHHLIFTDADCAPSSDQWLKEMASGFSNQNNLVLGASQYLKEKGLTNYLIRFETAQIATQYLSFAKAKIPYMGVGRNLGYTQELYDSVRGFKSHYFIPSGDDDLFVNEAAQKKNTSIILSENAITLSIPKHSFKDWMFQKSRHLSTGGHYKFMHKLLLGLYPLSLLIMYIFFGMSMVIHNWWYIALGLVLFRILLQIIIFSRPYRIMRAVDTLFMLPFLEVTMVFINSFIWFKNKLKN